MCKAKKYANIPNPKIDECMKRLIKSLSWWIDGAEIVSCCCGHNKYPMTIVCKYKNDGRYFELISNEWIYRKRKFYKRDKYGYYYIPETLYSTYRMKLTKEGFKVIKKID